MRCAQCDRLAIPQAVGRSPEGLVVFGWCLGCLEEAGCTEIEAVARPRARRVLTHVSGTVVTAAHAAPSRTDRRRLLLLFASFLGAWSIVLMTMGIWTSRQAPPPVPSPLGNGKPMFFFAGGAATAMTCLLLLGLSHGRALFASRRACRWIQSGSFLLALAILGTGIVFHDPSQDPFVVAAAGLALGLSVGAHWRESRLPAAPARAGSLQSHRLRRH